MKKKKLVIIDTDPGVDDALAIMMLLKSSHIDVKAITTVAGNKDIQVVTDNAKTILHCLNSNIPIYSGADKPLIKELLTGEVMGDTGLGGVKRIMGTPLNKLAVEKLLELVSLYPNEITILAIGPLTNIALAMQADQSFASNVKEIVIMGGAVESYGNMNRVAEFNFFVDPEAAAIVLEANCKKTLVTLDRCYEVPLFLRDFESIPKSTLSEFITSMIVPYIDNLAQFEGQKGAIVYDALAAYFILNPSSYQITSMDIKVEVSGEMTRGMCVVERRPNKEKKLNVEVVTKIDSRSFKREFIDILSI